jgi:hypothetical protein
VVSYKEYLKNHRRHESRIIGAAPPEIGGHFIRVGTEQRRVVGVQGRQIYSVGRGSGSRLENFRHHKFLVPYVNHQ